MLRYLHVWILTKNFTSLDKDSDSIWPLCPFLLAVDFFEIPSTLPAF